MHKWFLPVAMLFFTSARAQYYYNDIVGNRIARTNFMLLKSTGVKTVSVASFDPDGTATEGFTIRQNVNTQRNTIETTSQNAYANNSVLTTAYSAGGWPVSVSDSSDASVTHISYTYTGSGDQQQIAAIVSATGFPGETGGQFVEQRRYTFSNNKPVSMVRTKNGKDTLLVKFIPEEHGWVGEERWVQKGRTIERYYYYYNEAGQLTDIARYNPVAQRTLPDYTFEWNPQKQLTSMITVLSGTSQYRTWRYTYDARGLKTNEVVYNKLHQPEGRLVYTYD